MLRAALLALAFSTSLACGLVDALAPDGTLDPPGTLGPPDGALGPPDEDGEDGGCGTGSLLTARAIAVGFDRSCALDCDGAAVCWGAGDDQAPPATPFAAVTVGQSFACGLAASGAVSCWGGTAIEPTVPLTAFAAGQDFLCGLDDGGALSCFGASGWPSFEAPSGVFSALAVGWGYVCATRRDTGALQCGGTTPRYPPPAGVALAQVGVGSRFACGLDDAGAIVCFDDDGPVTDGVPGGAFRALGVGDGTACAIRVDDGPDDGALACWSETDEGALVVAQAPPGRFAHVAVADAHACAIRADAAVLCWGDALYGRIDVPAP